MKWWLIWVCACNADLSVIYADTTEAKVRAVAKQLYEREDTRGSYIVARLSDGFEHGMVVVWNEEESKVEYIGDTWREGRPRVPSSHD